MNCLTPKWNFSDDFIEIKFNFFKNSLYNLLFSKCENHNTIITSNHIKNLHNITNPLSLSAIINEDHILYEKIKKSKSSRKNL